MCGFAGTLDLRDERRTCRETLELMTETLVHRGPDSAGYFVDERVGLGARRLRIIDLETGEQPIYNEDCSVVLVCNGEIFNYRQLRQELIERGHRLASKTDIEVIVHLYEELGPDLLPRLDGQFAFALYDLPRRRLLLARDHFGVNPLHFAVVDGLLLFASEIKALLQHPSAPRTLDLTGLDQILTFPGLVSPRTMIRGIESLESGHYLLADGPEIRRAEYWDLDYPRIGEADYDHPESYYLDELRERLDRSVRARLQADVPVGFYLSGGVDSSLIAELIRQASPDVARHSFSVTFTDQEISEARYQRLMAERVHSVHHEIPFDEAAIADRLTRMVYHCECPVKETFDTCALALSEAVRGTGVKVVLAGQGADEIFAGYMGYRFDRLGLRSGGGQDLDTILEDELREQLWGDSGIFYEKDFYAFREVRAVLYSPAVRAEFPEFDCTNVSPVDKQRLAGRDPLHQRSYLDFKLRLSDHLLSEHGDRMAMANSVEGRYPFLDLGIIDLARRMPPHLKVNEFTEKYIVKKLASELVPHEIVERDKFGFRAPASPFLLRLEWVQDMLSHERLRRQGYFDPDLVETLKRRYSKPGFRLNAHLDTDLLMIVLTFGILLDQFHLPAFG
jgi:asparagine synthase (glutamine-hydrolysing)